MLLSEAHSDECFLLCTTFTYFTAFFQVIKYFLKRLFEVGFKDVFHELVEPCSICVIYKAIVVDTVDLMDEQADYIVFVLHRFLLHQQAALDNA